MNGGNLGNELATVLISALCCELLNKTSCLDAKIRRKIRNAIIVAIDFSLISQY